MKDFMQIKLDNIVNKVNSIINPKGFNLEKNVSEYAENHYSVTIKLYNNGKYEDKLFDALSEILDLPNLPDLTYILDYKIIEDDKKVVFLGEYIAPNREQTLASFIQSAYDRAEI